MRQIAVIFAAWLIAPAAAMADAQFTAEDIIRHFKQSETARAQPKLALPKRTTGGARTTTTDDDGPLKLPLTGAKRGVTLGGTTTKTRVGTVIGTSTSSATGTTIGTGGGGGMNLLITFESGSDRLTGQAKRNLDAFAAALKSPSLSSFAFEVQGHTDARGAADVNQRLSQRRAESVVAYLVRSGIYGDRLLARGYGESRPMMSDPRHPQNRRVETRRIR